MQSDNWVQKTVLFPNDIIHKNNTMASTLKKRHSVFPRYTSSKQYVLFFDIENSPS